MKVLLIYPPSRHMIRTNVPELVDEETGLYPPLGLLYIAAHLEKNTNHKVEVLDTQVERLNYGQIEKEIEKRRPDLVGIHTTTFTLIDTLLVAKIIKKFNENIHICLGGPHVNIYPDETINFPEVDSLVLREGEIAFTELVEYLDRGGNLKDIKGLVFKDNGKIIHTGLRDFIDNLDSLPYPARHLTPYKRYYSLLAKRSPITTMMTSRGCPYRCIFCYRPHMGKRFRVRSARNVADEMQSCINLGIKEFFLYDDTFNIAKQRVINICDEIINRKLDIGWDIRARIDTMEEEMLRKLKDAGCERIHYGVEAGTPQILSVLNKEITIEEVKKVFALTKEVGITTLAYFMLGSPTETKKQIMETIDFAVRLNPDYAHISVTTPFPATELYKLGLEKGIFTNDYWREFAYNPKEDFVPQIWEEVLSREELGQLLKYAYRRFYLRPKYIMRTLLNIRSIKEFNRKLKAGLGLLKLR